MSFMRLLAAGRSIMGIKPAPSPYRMSQDHVLPTFARPAKAAGSGVVPIQGDLPAAEQQPPQQPLSGAPAAKTVANDPGLGRRSFTLGRSGGRSWSWGRWTGGWLRWKKSGQGRQTTAVRTAARAVQTELSLDSVRVVRNDLADMDTPGNQRSKWRDSDGRGRPLGMVWNRLSARLLRQAVQEFNVVQKERGKLLSQADHGDGSARGA